MRQDSRTSSTTSTPTRGAPTLIPTTPSRGAVNNNATPIPTTPSRGSVNASFTSSNVSSSAPSNKAISHSKVCTAIQSNQPTADALLKSVNDLDCQWEDQGKSYKTTALYCACREGRADHVTKLLMRKETKTGGIQEDLNGQTPLHAAQLSGDVNIVVMLLLVGEKPVTNKANQNPYQLLPIGANAFTKTKLEKVWASFRRGVETLVVDFPEIENELRSRTVNRSKPDASTAEKKIIEYISNNPSVPNLAGKILMPNWQGESLADAFQALLKFFKYRQLDNNKTVIELHNQWLKEEEDPTATSRPSRNLIKGVTQIFSVNIFIVVYSYDRNEIRIKKHYSNKYNKNACPYLYLAFNGVRYIPIIEDESQSQGPTPPDILLSMIERPEISAETFLVALQNADLARINDIYKFKPNDRNFTMDTTVLYFACRCGRTDLVRTLLGFDAVKLDGVQESFDKNSPLHVASWRGHYNIVAMLLYKGADATAKNGKGELPRIYDNSLPQNVRDVLYKIWTAYDKGMATFKKEFNNFVIVEKPSDSAANVNNPTASNVATLSFLTSSGNITVNQLCTILDMDNPISPGEFRNILENRIDKKLLNTQSEIHKCTPLYAASRSGQYEMVKQLVEIGGVQVRGIQESRSGDGNTPLHVANWRGNVRVVAYLLAKNAPLEPKTGGSKAKPNALAERNFTLSEEKRTALATVFQLAERGKMDEVMKIAEHADLEFDAFSAGKPLPLWAYIGLPKEELPPQYAKLDYIWYQKVGDKMTLLELTQCSHLNALFKRYSKSGGSQAQWPTDMPVPPSTGFFNATQHWSYEKWTVDFQKLEATIDNRKIHLAVISRAKTWYYSATKDGPYLCFPNKINNTIGDAFTSNLPAIQFPYLMEKSFFGLARPASCLVNFEKKECNITQHNSPTTTHKVLVEDEYNRRSFWEPDMYLPRQKQDYKHDVVTPVDLAPTDEQYKNICNSFYLTMPDNEKGKKINTIVKIQRLFYPALRERWEQQLTAAQEVHAADPQFKMSIPYTKLLWHGTGGTDPMKIAAAGWRINFASNRNLWGRGTYFASDAAYSAGYSYQDKTTGNRKMFLAQVITGLGLQCLENSNIIDVPKGYNSIVGWRHGAWIYVAYDSLIAFPTYLVEWSEK